jgi:hypothetical protein
MAVGALAPIDGVVRQSDVLSVGAEHPAASDAERRELFRIPDQPCAHRQRTADELDRLERVATAIVVAQPELGRRAKSKSCLIRRIAQHDDPPDARVTTRV